MVRIKSVEEDESAWGISLKSFQKNPFLKKEKADNFDKFVKNLKMDLLVIPAKAGIQNSLNPARSGADGFITKPPIIMIT